MEALIVPAQQLMAQLAHNRLHQPGSSDADARALAAALASIDSVNWDEAGNRGLKPHALYLRGGMSFLLHGTSPEARRHLEQAVKLKPGLVEAWHCLGHAAWEAGDLVMALHCFSCSMQQGPNKEGLRQLSMVLRQLAHQAGVCDESHAEVLDASLAAARQAVALDVGDGYSWYVLGLAQLAHGFNAGQLRQHSQQKQHSTTHSLQQQHAQQHQHTHDAQNEQQQHHQDHQQLHQDEQELEQQQRHQTQHQQQRPQAPSANRGRQLQQVLAAFQRAQGCGLCSLADLFYNRGVVQLYRADFGAALQDFRAAGALNAALPVATQSSAILRLLTELHQLTRRSAGLKPKQLSTLVAQLSKDMARVLVPQGFRVCKLEELQKGPNARCALVCRPVMVVDSPAGAATMYCVAMVAGGTCFALSMLGLPPLPALLGRQLTLLEPTVMPVDVAWDGRAFNFQCLCMEEVQGLLLDGVPMDAPGSTNAALLASWLQ